MSHISSLLFVCSGDVTALSHDKTEYWRQKPLKTDLVSDQLMGRVSTASSMVKGSLSTPSFFPHPKRMRNDEINS